MAGVGPVSIAALSPPVSWCSFARNPDTGPPCAPLQVPVKAQLTSALAQLRHTCEGLGSLQCAA